MYVKIPIDIDPKELLEYAEGYDDTINVAQVILNNLTHDEQGDVLQVVDSEVMIEELERRGYYVTR